MPSLDLDAGVFLSSLLLNKRRGKSRQHSMKLDYSDMSIDDKTHEGAWVEI